MIELTHRDKSGSIWIAPSQVATVEAPGDQYVRPGQGAVVTLNDGREFLVSQNAREVVRTIIRENNLAR